MKGLKTYNIYSIIVNTGRENITTGKISTGGYTPSNQCRQDR